MYRHQTIAYDAILPARIELNDATVDRCRGEPHWHEEIQLLYIDEGSRGSPSETGSCISAQAMCCR